MKVVLWIMLVANLVFFAVMQWGSHWFAPPALEQAEPELNPQRIALQRTSPPPTAPAVVASSVPVSAVASAVAASSAVASAVPKVDTAANNRLACMEWAAFSSADLIQAQKDLALLSLSTPVIPRTINHNNTYWAYIPPLKAPAKLKQKLAELNAAGLKEYALVQEAGAWENAISLGIFNTQASAQNFVATLRKVTGVKVGEYRPAYQETALTLNDLDGITVAKLTELQKRFPQSNLNAIPCQTPSK